MARKRERRLRRKARAQVRAVEIERDQLASLRTIALAAIRYVGEIDAPNLAEPWSIAKRRDELVDLVHAHQGRPERTRRDAQVSRPAPVIPLHTAGQFFGDHEERGSGQPAPHETQQGADTPGHRASEAAGNVADPHRTPIGHRGAGSSSPLRFVPASRKESSMSKEQVARDLEQKRRELRTAAQKYGAAANKRHRDARVVEQLAQELETLAMAYAQAALRASADPAIGAAS